MIEPKLNLANQKNSAEVTNWNMSKDIFTKNRDDSKAAPSTKRSVQHGRRVSKAIKYQLYAQPVDS